jgi:hypothetical protein
VLSLFFVLVRLSCCFICFSLLFLVCDVDFVMLSLCFVFNLILNFFLFLFLCFWICMLLFSIVFCMCSLFCFVCLKFVFVIDVVFLIFSSL